MQNQNFSIGDLKKREFKDAQSTYKSHISQQNTSQSTTRTPIQLGLRNSHFHLGTEKNISYVSESKNQFQPMDPKSVKSSNNAELSKSLKQNHFTLAEFSGQPRNYFGTIHKQEYNFKGDPSLIRGTMAEEVRADLRASHFKVGFDQQGPFKNSQNNARPATGYQRVAGTATLSHAASAQSVGRPITSNTL